MLEMKQGMRSLHSLLYILVPCLVPKFLKLQISENHQKARNLDLSVFSGT